MRNPPTILLVGDDPKWMEDLRALLSGSMAVRILITRDATQGLSVARRSIPDLVVCERFESEGDLLELRACMKADPDLSRVPLLGVALEAKQGTRVPTKAVDPHELLVYPFDEDLARSKVLALIEIKSLGDQLKATEIEIDQLREVVARSRDRQLDLLVRLLDLVVPGSAQRGERIAGLSMKVAERMGIPAVLLPDLEIAARLHELGRLMAPPGSGRMSPFPSDESPWQMVRYTRWMLEEVGGLDGAAELVGGIQENWDGTGLPDHAEMGRIPLRCRILRVAIDAVRSLDGVDRLAPEESLEALQEHSGTLYDPLVLVHVRQIIMNEIPGSGGESRHILVPVTELREGMTLAEDLTTDSGVKLLSRDTVLSAHTIDVILRRHRHDPILRCVVLRADREEPPKLRLA